MQYTLPQSIKIRLAARSIRLHHLLWHTIRNNWHKFTQEEQDFFRKNHPGWVPANPRFIRYPSGLVMVNNDAGESFLYMHRQMLSEVNKQLAADNEPAIISWQSIPPPDDPDYPVPDRGATTDKSDDFYKELRIREEKLLDPVHLRKNSLARIGAYLESAVHDPLHRRWATLSPGLMENFPVLDPKNTDPVIADSFDLPDADWLAHPYSSHVNPVFWKLHGWCDDVIERWRIANNLSSVTWNDKWVGGGQYHDGIHSSPDKKNLGHASHQHDHHGHHHGSDKELFKVFRTLNTFEDCQIGFDYLEKNNIPLPELN